jgi:hypothetical protein
MLPVTGTASDTVARCCEVHTAAGQSAQVQRMGGAEKHTRLTHGVKVGCARSGRWQTLVTQLRLRTE